jgi:hypothetical protein
MRNLGAVWRQQADLTSARQRPSGLTKRVREHRPPGVPCVNPASNCSPRLLERSAEELEHRGDRLLRGFLRHVVADQGAAQEVGVSP